MDTVDRKSLGKGVLAAVGGIAFLYAAGRIISALFRKMIRRMMRSMMAEMMRGEGGLDIPET